MSDADCTPGREPRSVAASFDISDVALFSLCCKSENWMWLIYQFMEKKSPVFLVPVAIVDVTSKLYETSVEYLLTLRVIHV